MQENLSKFVVDTANFLGRPYLLLYFRPRYAGGGLRRGFGAMFVGLGMGVGSGKGKNPLLNPRITGGGGRLSRPRLALPKKSVGPVVV